MRLIGHTAKDLWYILRASLDQLPQQTLAVGRDPPCDPTTLWTRGSHLSVPSRSFAHGHGFQALALTLNVYVSHSSLLKRAAGARFEGVPRPSLSTTTR